MTCCAWTLDQTVLDELQFWISSWSCLTTGYGRLVHSQLISHCLPLDTMATHSLSTSFLGQGLAFWALWEALSGSWIARGTMGGSFLVQEGSILRRNCLVTETELKTMVEWGQLASKHRKILEGETPRIIFLILLIIGRSHLFISQIWACSEPQALNAFWCLHASVVKLRIFHKELHVKCFEKFINIHWPQWKNEKWIIEVDNILVV